MEEHTLYDWILVTAPLWSISPWVIGGLWLCWDMRRWDKD